jgi:hypothetical protein
MKKEIELDSSSEMLAYMSFFSTRLGNYDPTSCHGCELGQQSLPWSTSGCLLAESRNWASYSVEGRGTDGRL